MNLKIKEKTLNILVSLALTSTYLVLSLQYLFLSFYNISNVNIVSKILVGSIFLMSFPWVFKIKWKFIIKVYLIFLFIYLFNLLFFSNNIALINNNLVSIVLVSLPTFIYSYFINDFNTFLKALEKISLFILTIGLLVFILNIFGELNIGTYSMTLSYYILLPALIYINKFINKLEITSLLYFALSIIIILILGARGPILSIGVFLLLRFIFGINKNLSKIFVSSCFVFSLFSGFLIFYQDIFSIVYDFLIRYSIESRTIKLLSNGNLLYLSGRKKLYSLVWSEIIKKPFLGIGLLGDRRIINTYSHNIFLEISAHFGIIIGWVIVSLILFTFLYNLINIKNKIELELLEIWFSLGFVHLLISSSYIIDFRFWIFLGLNLHIFILYFFKRKELI